MEANSTGETITTGATATEVGIVLDFLFVYWSFVADSRNELAAQFAAYLQHLAARGVDTAALMDQLDAVSVAA